MPNEVVSEIQAAASEADRLTAVVDMITADQRTVRLLVGLDEAELPQSLVRLLVAGAEALRTGDSLVLVRQEEEVSPAEAAKLLGVSRQYVDRLVANGVLPARQLPHSRYRKIPARAVLAHCASKRSKRAGVASILEAADETGVPY
ncbi:MAG: helix-turn-helix domain-containing protein [Acidimicrobiales bacterium]